MLEILAKHFPTIDFFPQKNLGPVVYLTNNGVVLLF